MTAPSPSDALRRGWTTGACATAAAKAALSALATGRFPDPVQITLPRGRQVAFALAREHLGDGQASAAVIKDAGDDPDVTHGALVVASVRLGAPASGLVFANGEGVGRVTKPGLALGVGEPAINPGPRAMMAAMVEELCQAHGLAGDVEIEIAIPGGEEMARHTMNARLGIVGGLSILGTTGIVTPYSCAAWIAGIHQGIDVARAEGLMHVAAATGSTSEAAVQRLYGFSEQALLDMGDFAGAVLKHLKRHPIPRLTIAGGFAKICKLAGGHMDLHSARTPLDFSELAALAAELPHGEEVANLCATANTAGEVLAAARSHGLPLADLVAERARTFAQSIVGAGVAVEVVIFGRDGELAGRSAGFDA